MLFNSYAFLFGFLPAALIICCIADRWPSARLPVLIALSFAFYGYWDVRFVPLLLGSIVVNWAAAQLFLRKRHPWIVTAAIALNLLVLGIFKYWDFFAASVGHASGSALPYLNLALPLGIS